jgi:Domain of unknown function (DUF4333)
VATVRRSWTKELRFLGALALGLALAFLALGCGDTVIDSGKTEETIKASLEKSRHEKISAVDCPSDQKVVAGATFVCTVEYPNGERKTATLKIRNTDADLTLVGLKQK